VLSAAAALVFAPVEVATDGLVVSA
jgi:hypothetical protein